MTDVSNNGMFEAAALRGALDLDGATVEEAGPENPSDGEFPDRDTDGSLVGRADVDADEAASKGEPI